MPKLLANIYSGIITIGTRSEVIRQKYRDNNHKEEQEEPPLGSAFAKQVEPQVFVHIRNVFQEPFVNKMPQNAI